MTRFLDLAIEFLHTCRAFCEDNLISRHLTFQKHSCLIFPLR